MKTTNPYSHCPYPDCDCDCVDCLQWIAFERGANTKVDFDELLAKSSVGAPFKEPDADELAIAMRELAKIDEGQYSVAYLESVTAREPAEDDDHDYEEDQLARELLATKKRFAAFQTANDRMAPVLSAIEGALMDSGNVVPADESGYADAVREIVKQRNDLAGLARALVDALPKCVDEPECRSVATRLLDAHKPALPVCDVEHDGPHHGPELPYAAPLRALVAKLDELAKGGGA